MNRFESCLDFVLNVEGGLSDDPADRGGRTNLGITEGTLARARSDGLTKAAEVDSLTKEVAAAIYRAYYWKPCRCGELPKPIDLAVFDAAVHMGTSAASRQIQRALNLLGAEPPLAEDGIVGVRTLEAARQLPRKWRLRAARVTLAVRSAALLGLASRSVSQRRFLAGWLNRLDRVLERGRREAD
ncbi:MAG: glycoside hydrolase family 108 protein [Synergistales bacterium]|jgi:lysozyme family protein